MPTPWPCWWKPANRPWSGVRPAAPNRTSPNRSRPPAGREYVDVRALLLDPVDLRGIPWRDGADRTRWAPPSFLPPSDDPGRWLINLEELPSALPMVQAALYQLVLDRKCGEYELPEGASLIACGNRESDRGVTHRMPTPLASRFVHLEIRVDAADWCAWTAVNGIAAEVIFFVQLRPELLHQFDPQSREAAELRSWRLGIADTDYWDERSAFAGVGTDVLVMQADPEPPEAQALHRALGLAGFQGGSERTLRLFAPELRFDGYPWYDALVRVTGIETLVTVDGAVRSASRNGPRPS